MPCPVCGATTTGGGSGPTYSVREKAIKRTRVCTGPVEHRIPTVERADVGELLSRTQIGSGDDAPLYDRGRLLKDLHYAIGSILNTRTRRWVVHRVEASLLPLLLPGKTRDPSLPGGVAARLSSSMVHEAVVRVIRDEAKNPGVTQQRRRDFRRAHVMWVLARGTGAAGPFEGASQVLTWLEAEYGREADRTGSGFTVERHYHRVVTETWHPLRSDAAPEPKWIVFLLRSEVPLADGDAGPQTQFEHRRLPYERDRLLTSVRHALAGRNDHYRTAQLVVQWTLWSLGGQNVVRSADLASQVTQCLRRVDEVAYMRWCIRVKDLDVHDVWQEALGLLAWPHPRLQFAPEAAQDPRRTTQVMPGASDDAVVDLVPWIEEKDSAEVDDKLG